jgi:hypothetical protein
MEVKFVNENIFTKDADAGLFIIDVDMQGVWLNAEQHLFYNAFPKTFKRYQMICRTQYKDKAGTCIFLEEDGYKIALIVTKIYRKTKKEDVVENFERALKHLFTFIPSDVFLYSPVLGRGDRCGSEFLGKINKLLLNEKNGAAPRNWTVCRG